MSARTRGTRAGPPGGRGQRERLERARAAAGEPELGELGCRDREPSGRGAKEGRTRAVGDEEGERRQDGGEVLDDQGRVDAPEPGDQG